MTREPRLSTRLRACHWVVVKAMLICQMTKTMLLQVLSAGLAHQIGVTQLALELIALGTAEKSAPRM